MEVPHDPEEPGERGDVVESLGGQWSRCLGVHRTRRIADDLQRRIIHVHGAAAAEHEPHGELGGVGLHVADDLVLAPLRGDDRPVLHVVEQSHAVRLAIGADPHPALRAFLDADGGAEAHALAPVGLGVHGLHEVAELGRLARAGPRDPHADMPLERPRGDHLRGVAERAGGVQPAIRDSPGDDLLEGAVRQLAPRAGGQEEKKEQDRREAERKAFAHWVSSDPIRWRSRRRSPATTPD